MRDWLMQDMVDDEDYSCCDEGCLLFGVAEVEGVDASEINLLLEFV